MKQLFLIALLVMTTALPAWADSAATIRFARGTAQLQTATGAHVLRIELAETPEQQQHGLMFRQSLSADSGMLFVFDKEQPISMWMKNTYIPLDMLFINKAGVVVDIHRNAEPHSLATITARQPASMVLELNAGAADIFGIQTGDSFRYERALPE